MGRKHTHTHTHTLRWRSTVYRNLFFIQVLVLDKKHYTSLTYYRNRAQTPPIYRKNLPSCASKRMAPLNVKTLATVIISCLPERARSSIQCCIIIMIVELSQLAAMYSLLFWDTFRWVPYSRRSNPSLVHSQQRPRGAHTLSFRRGTRPTILACMKRWVSTINSP